MRILFIRRKLFSGKKLNIFSPTTDEEGVESAIGNEEFLSFLFSVMDPI